MSEVEGYYLYSDNPAQWTRAYKYNSQTGHLSSVFSDDPMEGGYNHSSVIKHYASPPETDDSISQDPNRWIKSMNYFVSDEWTEEGPFNPWGIPSNALYFDFHVFDGYVDNPPAHERELLINSTMPGEHILYDRVPEMGGALEKGLVNITFGYVIKTSTYSLIRKPWGPFYDRGEKISEQIDFISGNDIEDYYDLSSAASKQEFIDMFYRLATLWLSFDAQADWL